jgi:hypothetical protein
MGTHETDYDKKLSSPGGHRFGAFFLPVGFGSWLGAARERQGRQ